MLYSPLVMQFASVNEISIAVKELDKDCDFEIDTGFINIEEYLPIIRFQMEKIGIIKSFWRTLIFGKN